MSDDAYDERSGELEALQACYPDECVLTSTVSGYVELAVNLDNPLQLILERPDTQVVEEEQQHLISHLPPIRIAFTLPNHYPEGAAPQISLQLTPNWLPKNLTEEMEHIASSLWEDYGRAPVLCTYISDIDERAKTAFDLSELQVTVELLSQLLDFNRAAAKAQFDKGTYDCGVCLDPKKGSSCHRMDHCDHVFCIQCLKDCYNNAILTGDMDSVKCLAYNCGSENDDAQTRRAKKVRLITPRELLQIPIERPAVQRYVDIRRKKKLEADKSTIWCPRKGCNGAAKGNNYPKLAIPLEEMRDIYDTDPPPPNLPQAPTPSEPLTQEDDLAQDALLLATRLHICEFCSHAFCRLCNCTWHGDYYDCRPRMESATERAKMSKENQDSEDYILTHTSPCPRCETRVQKSEACNHMRCIQCGTHFCYLCSANLDGGNPYRHFGVPGTPCYQRLWVLEEGDDGKVEVEFGGARGAEIAARQVLEVMDELPGV